MRFADPLAQAEIDLLRAENRTLRRGSRTLGEIITATNRDLAELVGWEIDEDQDSVEWAAAWDQLREMRAELVRLRAKIARAEAIHKPVQEAPEYDPFCVGCWDAGGQDGAPSWPCPTILALRDPEESA